MKVAFFDAHKFEVEFFDKAFEGSANSLTFFETRLDLKGAKLASGYDCVCCFVNDVLDAPVLKALSENGVRLVALRCAGFNHVDLAAAKKYGVAVARVPAYSPHSVAEHSLALLMTLTRKIHRSYNRSRESNFSLDGLVGVNLNKKTAGVVGTGKIGSVFCDIMLGLGCEVLAYDLEENPELLAKGVKYTSLDEIYKSSHIVSLHIPLNKSTHHILDKVAFEKMRKDVVLINTSRGGLVDTKALIGSLKSQTIAGAGLDVYEEEESVFFHDHSGDILQDDDLARLLTFPNVVITAHQAFLTKEALEEIARVTLGNIKGFAAGHAENLLHHKA